MTTTTAATDTVTWTPMITNFEVAYTYGAADAPKNAVITIGADTADEAIDRAQHLADYFPRLPRPRRPPRPLRPLLRLTPTGRARPQPGRGLTPNPKECTR